MIATTTPALFDLDVPGQLDIFDALNDQQEETTVIETPAPRKAPARRTTNSAHRTYVAILGNGRIATRSSKSMAYSHLVELTTPHSGTFALSWHKSVRAAQKAADALRGGNDNWPVVTSVRVRMVASHQYNSAEAKAAREQEKAEQAS